MLNSEQYSAHAVVAAQWPYVNGPQFVMITIDMAERERVEKAVFEAIDEMNGQLPAGIVIEKSLDAPLYGKTGKLESLDFVALIVEVESKIQSEFGIDFVLTDENLLSKESSPFVTVGSLIEHLEEVIDEK